MLIRSAGDSHYTAMPVRSAGDSHYTVMPTRSACSTANVRFVLKRSNLKKKTLHRTCCSKEKWLIKE